jgi:hypothetical protein
MANFILRPYAIQSTFHSHRILLSGALCCDELSGPPFRIRFAEGCGLGFNSVASPRDIFLTQPKAELRDKTGQAKTFPLISTVRSNRFTN